MMAGAGSFFFIRDHLDALIEGRMEKVRFVVPSRLTEYGFRIYAISGREAGEPVMKLRLEIDNWFIRLFAPHVEFDYDKVNRRLQRFRGPTNIVDPEGSLEKARIDFEYYD
jgi:hypothetical protein